MKEAEGGRVVVELREDVCLVVTTCEPGNGTECVYWCDGTGGGAIGLPHRKPLPSGDPLRAIQPRCPPCWRGRRGQPCEGCMLVFPCTVGCTTVTALKTECSFASLSLPLMSITLSVVLPLFSLTLTCPCTCLLLTEAFKFLATVYIYHSSILRKFYTKHPYP